MITLTRSEASTLFATLRLNSYSSAVHASAVALLHAMEITAELEGAGTSTTISAPHVRRSRGGRFARARNEWVNIKT
jgi:hypothetical protein